jgi:signal transduction histidine kinase
MLVGVIRIEKADIELGEFVLTVSEDLDCSGLPELDYEICVYDEGFIAGLMESFTGKKFKVKEIDCWCTGDRTCRFTANDQLANIVDKIIEIHESASNDKLDKDIVRERIYDILFPILENNQNNGLNNVCIDNIESILHDRNPITVTPDNINFDKRLKSIYEELKILRDCIVKLSKGDLSFDMKIKGFIPGSINMLLSNLKHLSWQALMVSKGDFSHRIDFMGDFSNAFNEMVVQLDNFVTKIKNQEQELRELNADKDKFFSIIAHDLRGPIGTFNNITDLLIDRYDSFSKDELKEFIVSIRDSSGNIYSLLENLLSWARIKRGIIECQPNYFHIGDIVYKCLNIFEQSASQKEIVLEYSGDPDIIVYGDQNIIETVFRNLISNSLKFTPKKGKIGINIEYSQNEPFFVQVSINDNGMGMDQDLVNKLFIIGGVRSSKGTEGEPGTGLGLILCKEFVEMNKGTIWVESEPDKGSSFYFTIPIKRLARDEN